jgi:hypothetical protein
MSYTLTNYLALFLETLYNYIITIQLCIKERVMKNKVVEYWFNRCGVDECYKSIEVDGDVSDKECIRSVVKEYEGECCDNYVNEFYDETEEYGNDKVKCYGWDGIGIYIGDSKEDIDNCVNEYAKRYNEEWEKEMSEYELKEKRRKEEMNKKKVDEIWTGTKH